MVMFIRGSGVMIWQMDKEPINIVEERNMMEIGRMIYKTVKV
jgi:hypothetical protein